MQLEPKERKLLALMLDPGASDGEVANACAAFCRLLRGRKATLPELLEETSTSPVASMINAAEWGLFRMTFGKYQGEMLADISLKDLGYLAFIRNWIRSVPDKNKNLRLHLEALEKYLGV